jgi:hypothetical protein
VSHRVVWHHATKVKLNSDCVTPCDTKIMCKYNKCASITCKYHVTKVRINPNCVAWCCTTWRDTKMSCVNTPLKWMSLSLKCHGGRLFIFTFYNIGIFISKTYVIIGVFDCNYWNLYTKNSFHFFFNFSRIFGKNCRKLWSRHRSQVIEEKCQKRDLEPVKPLIRWSRWSGKAADPVKPLIR